MPTHYPLLGVKCSIEEIPSLRRMDPSRDILLAVLAAVAEDYRRNISIKTKAAYAKRKALADAQGVPVKWGRRGKGKRVPPATTPGTAS
jgi:DNA invertase Pin-like site-specific DNA recombinase